MNEALVFLQGLVMGVVIAAPIGPGGTYCITRILSGGRKSGMACAAGVALADGFYSFLAVLGLAVAKKFLSAHHILFLIIAGAFLLLLGIKTMLTRVNPSEKPNGSFWSTFGNILVLSAVNPSAVLAFASLYTVFGLAGPEHTLPFLGTFIPGIMAGAGLWWAGMTEILLLIRRKYLSTRLTWVNRIGGMILAMFGLGTLARILFVIHT